MKQTAVDWLIEKLPLIQKEGLSDEIEQAKEMEKQHIIDAHVTGIIEPLIMKNYKGLSVDEIQVEITKQAEEYYNETFKNS